MNHVYDILDTLKEELRDNVAVNTVSFGDITEIDLNKTSIFPLSHIILGTSRHLGNLIEFDITVIMADVVDVSNVAESNDEFYGNDNLQDVLNTQFQVGNRVVNGMLRASRFHTNMYDRDYRIVSDPTLEPFIDRFSNLLAGYELNFTVQVPNNSSVC